MATPSRLLPIVGSPVLGPAGHEPVRADAARNREALLVAAQHLVASRGVTQVTMDAVAQAAGVGKGTVFRRFHSREGLMGALLNSSEAAWQSAVISGPPPLGPGAPPYDRLLAFARSRLEATLAQAELIEAAGASSDQGLPALSFAAMHVRMLLVALDVDGDLPLLATALLAPLEMPVLRQQVRVDGFPVERVLHGWADLLDRVLRRPG
ncbi:MAG: TetR/AcrR family transcriptional regulator [Actinomycetota bacterium]|nr:TetR/AcrR family transcriptional regulator [Actinomycetota bacterium]